MKKRFLPLLLALCGSATVSWADTPVKVTTVADGGFAEGTHWYYLSIGAQGFRISDNRNNSFITLGGTRRATADNVWCFVGNESEGYMIYNMNAGTKKALAAPKEMKGNTGAEAYAHLMPIENLSSDYTNRWDITAAPTSYGIKNGFYISEHGESNKTLNNRDRKLAFWSTGKDAGSTIAITPLFDETNVGEMSLDMTTGIFADIGTGMLHEAHELLHGRASDTFGSGRIHIWKNVLKKIPDNLWFGTGPDTMTHAKLDAFTRYDADKGVELVAEIDTAHNEYLNILFHQGIFALLAYLAALIIAAVKWIKRGNATAAGAACGAAVLCYCIQAFFGITATHVANSSAMSTPCPLIIIILRACFMRARCLL